MHVPPLDESELPSGRFGDIVLQSASHEIVLPGAVAFAGRRFVRGDANGDLAVDVSDVVFLLLRLFAGGEALECPEAGDINDDGSGNVSDIIFLLQHLFRGGAAPPAGGISALVGRRTG